MIDGVIGQLRARPALAMSLMLIAMGGIFLADTVTNYEIAAAVFYIAVIIVAISLVPRRAVLVLALFCIVLTVVSFALTKPSGSHEAGLINSAMSICAIAITTYLALKAVAAEAAAHEAQAQLVRMARIATFGELTASIAHEINQPLAAIVTSSDACSRWLAQDPPNLERARKAVERIAKDARRASEIIVRVRGLTRGEAPRKTTFGVNEAILEVVDLARDELRRNNISLRLDLAEGQGQTFADKIQIEQVIGNLIINATEAMKDVNGRERTLDLTSRDDGSGQIVVLVADSGAGLAPDAANQLFDAFWTTKKTGMGLGLSLSRTIIEGSGGRIWAEPRMPHGAVFGFSLPLAKGGER